MSSYWKNVPDVIGDTGAKWATGQYGSQRKTREKTLGNNGTIMVIGNKYGQEQERSYL